MPAEEPSQSYLVACKVRLVVRFDAFGADDAPKAPAVLPQLRSGKKTVPNPLAATKDASGAFVLTSNAGSQPGGPQKQGSSKDGRTCVLEGIVPLSCSVQRNGVRTADTCTIELSYADLPVDPRTVSSCAVEVCMGTLSEEQFQAGVSGQPKGDSGAGSDAPAVLNVLPDEYVDAYGKTRTNVRFQGWVDEWEAEFPDDDPPTVQLECTDNTRLLIDVNAPPKLAVSPDKPIDEAVAGYMSNFPQFDGLRVEYRPAGGTRPTLKGILMPTAFKEKSGPPPAGGGTDKLTVWDYLTDIVGQVGHVIRVEGVTVIIQQPRTLYAGKFAGRPDDPFQGRRLPSGRVVKNRLWIYGRNVRRMNFKRKFAMRSPFNIEVRCYSPKRKKTLVQRYPTKGDGKDGSSKAGTKDSGRQTRTFPGEAADQKWNVYRVFGIDDEKTLRAFAQGIYEMIGRQELEARFETMNLGSFGGGNLDPDALDMQAGDPIDVEVNRDVEYLSTVAGIENDVAERAEAFMRSLGYPGDFAKAYGKALANVGFPTTFRTKSVVMAWGIDDGIELTIEATNYLEIRGDKQLPAGEEPEPVAGAEPSPVDVKVEDFGDGN